MRHKTAAMRYLAASLITLLIAGTSVPAQAQPFPRRGEEGGQVQSLDSILNGIRRSYPGQLSDVQGPMGGRYRIKWLTPDGRVLWIDADARTGQIMGVQGDPGGAPRNFGPSNFTPRFDNGPAREGGWDRPGRRRGD